MLQVFILPLRHLVPRALTVPTHSLGGTFLAVGFALGGQVQSMFRGADHGLYLCFPNNLWWFVLVQLPHLHIPHDLL